jgi:ABC-2 type transport system ATP-binding protein
MTETALVITDLKKKYASGTEALKGVSLTIPAGDFFALLGPNGAGKTTLIGIVTGLVTKTSGSVNVFGIDIEKEPEKARSQIGLCGQEINFDPWVPPLEVVVNQAGYYGIPRSVAIPRAKKLLEDLGLGDKLDQIGWALSGGMKRRLMIARAIIHEPKFLILDEPTAGVDVELRRGMWDYLTALTKRGTTILLTTHYLEEAERLAKHVAIINKGEIVVNGTMEEILKLHDGASPSSYGGGKLEEIFVKLTSSTN